MSNKTASERRYSRLVSSMFNQTKAFVPRNRKFLKKDFFAFFFSWVPDFLEDFEELGFDGQRDYVNYSTGTAGKLVRFFSDNGYFKPYKEGKHLACYEAVFDKDQRAKAKDAILDFYEGNGHEDAMNAVIQAALDTLQDLSSTDPALSDIDNMHRSEEREKFHKAYSYFLSRVTNHVDPEDILSELSWYTLCGRYNYPASERPTPNVYIASKGIIEIQTEYDNLDSRCKDADHLLVVALAATSFLSGTLISKNTYSVKWTSFLRKLGEDNAKIDIVITAPDSPAEIDAIKYKMRPTSLNKNIQPSDIISKNIERLEQDIDFHGLKNVHLYTTDIALPVSYVIAEYNNEHDKDTLKCDIYLPIFNSYVDAGNEYKLKNSMFSDSSVRQSFVLHRNDPCTHDLYETLRQNAYDILRASKKLL